MRLLTITAVAALAATSACGSGHSASPATAARTTPPKTASASVPAGRANVPGFSGPVESSDGATHVFGVCLHSWYTVTRSGMRVHVGHPGPATISVDLSMTDESEPPPQAHRRFVMARGRQAKDLRFPVIPHAGFPQITVTSGQRTLTCDAPRR